MITEAQNSRGKIVFNDFSKIDLVGKSSQNNISCMQIYNFNNNAGVLESGLGLQDLQMYMQNDITSRRATLNYQALGLEYINKVMHFKQYFSVSGDTTHRLLVHGADGKLYVYQMFSNVNNLNWTYELSFTTMPIVLEYKKDGLDSILISANDKLIVWSTGRVPYELTNVPTITSMCVHNDVLYCTIAGETDNIWYTSNLNPESVGSVSETTDYVVLSDERGGCRKILTFKENVYVFRDYGISRLNTYAKKAPTYNQIYLSNSKIYPNTVVVCGDCIVFMTSDGLYKFNGASVSKIEVLPQKLIAIANNYACATNLQDKYYLAVKLNFDDGQIVGCEANSEMKNNALIEFNLQNNSFQILRGVDIKDMLALKAEFEEKIIATFNSTYKDKIAEITNDGKCFDEILPKAYYSNYIVQDDLTDITIRKVIVESSKDVKFTIITDNGNYIFNTYTDGINEFQTIMPCRKFKIQISTSTQNPYVNIIQLEYVKRK